MAVLELLPEMIFDSGIVIRNTTVHDIDDIVRIWTELGQDPEQICGRKITRDDLYSSVVHGYSPDMLGADAERYRMKTVEDPTGRVLGYLDLYHGYPDRDILWISSLIVERASWGKGYSHIIMGTLCDEALKAGYMAIGTGVPVMNWPRIRFFLDEGLDRVMALTGDDDYAPGKLAMLCLGKFLC